MVEELEQVFEKDSNLGTSIVTEMLRLFRGDTRPKISAIGINKSQTGRGPGKSTEVEEYA
jgi:hypothetical protein